MLSNEKYKGYALLKKTFTTDFLEKTRKINEGEVPQCFVEDSHPAIIDPDIWDFVQLELARRKTFGKAYSSMKSIKHQKAKTALQGQKSRPAEPLKVKKCSKAHLHYYLLLPPKAVEVFKEEVRVKK